MMKYSMTKALLAMSVVFFVGCGGGSLEQPANETVVGGEVVVDLDGETIKQSLLQAGTPGVDASTTVYGYKAYKIPYKTTDEEGNIVDVSGLMVVPTGVPEAMTAAGFSLVSDSHGTIFANWEAPTEIASITNAPDGAPVILTSLAAFVTLQADYIGFGDSVDHYHPFVLKKSLANATVDFIKAAKEFASNNNIPLNGQLFLTGYSEGGYASVAALEKIENEGELQVTVAAPMAGPYIMDGLAAQVLSLDTLSVPSFMADVAYAYTKAYGQEITSVLNEPYASKLDGLFDGTKTRLEIDLELTTVTTGPDGLFTESFVSGFFSGNWFTLAANENNVHTWGPSTPVKLLHCKGDDVIPYDISVYTQQTMVGYGAQSVELIPVEDTLGLGTTVGHAECALLAYGIAANIFAQARQATIGY